MLRVRIDLHRCIGAGTCSVIAPAAFAWRKETAGKIELVDQTAVEEDVLREAALACPTQAIVLEEVATRPQDAHAPGSV